MKKIITFILLAVTINANAQVKSAFVQQVEKAFSTNKFHNNDLVSFDIALKFNGKTTLKGQVISATNSSAIKLIKEDGTIVVFDGKQVWINSNTGKNNTRARFDVFTWQYFFMAPFKMSDGGTKWTDLGEQKYLNDEKLEAAQLSFESGTGDASGDYYVVYKDKNSLIKAMGYIVTFGGKSLAEAEKNAHAIVYNNYKKIDGVYFAQNWNFHNWNKKSGLTNKIGEANISNIKFMKKGTVDFTKPVEGVGVTLNN